MAQSLELKLDEDFLFILNFACGNTHLFKDRPVERSLVESWFEKLCLEVHRGIEAKRIRNTYLVKLVTCVQSGVLQDPFLARPEAGPLKQLPQAIVAYNLDEPPWLQEFETQAAGMSNVGAKDFSTYQCVKRLDNGRGVCAYVAVSVADEGELPKWFEMGTGKPRLLSEMDTEVEDAFQRFMGSVEEQMNQSGQGGQQEMDDYCNLLLVAIRKELAGSVPPGGDAYLDQLIMDFSEFVADKSMGRELEGYGEVEGRAYLLGYLQKKLEFRQNAMAYVH